MPGKTETKGTYVSTAYALYQIKARVSIQGQEYSVKYPNCYAGVSELKLTWGEALHVVQNGAKWKGIG